METMGNALSKPGSIIPMLQNGEMNFQLWKTFDLIFSISKKGAVKELRFCRIFWGSLADFKIYKFIFVITVFLN
jgi:hypothetical protein